MYFFAGCSCVCVSGLLPKFLRETRNFFSSLLWLPSLLAISAPTFSPFWALSAVFPCQPLCRTQRWNDRGVWKHLLTLQYYLLLQDITVNPASPLPFITTLFSFWENVALAAAWDLYLSCCCGQAESWIPLPSRRQSVSHLATCITARSRAVLSCCLSLLQFPQVIIPSCDGLISPAKLNFLEGTRDNFRGVPPYQNERSSYLWWELSINPL